MTVVRHPGTFRDARGEERIEIVNDGTTLSVCIRGIDFAGRDFDALEPIGDVGAARRGGFVLAGASLCACEIRCEMRITVTTAVSDVTAVLTMHLTLGVPTLRGGIDREELSLQLDHPAGSIHSKGTTGWFEDELMDLQRCLPEGTYLRACIQCGLSDYSPAGHGLFGDLACFRDNEAGYRAVTCKSDLFAVWNTKTGFVQETYVCPRFERRRPGTGYRG